MNNKKPEYKAVDIENASKSTKTFVNKLLSQIPKGKALELTDQDLNLLPNQRTIIAKLIDLNNIPRIQRTTKNT